jgi:tetratricopeptide (TPR) repeat protein
MRVAILALGAVSILWAADEAKLALALKAQADFDRVETSAAPHSRDTAACIQSEAALLAVAAPEERSLILFRKGYCALIGAASASDASQFADAATAFDQAMEAWPARVAAATKQKLPPPPVPPALRVFAVVSRLEQNTGAGPVDAQEAQLTSALAHPVCEASLMSPDSCLAAIQVGNAWLGWINLGRGDSIAAARRFTMAQSPRWLQWVQGQEALRAGDYKKAATEYRGALDSWRKTQQDPAIPLVQRLSPAPDMAPMLTDLGAAQLLSHDAAAAIETLDAAVKINPSKPRAIYLRARAKEAASQADAALSDYDLASRTAYAASPGKSSGEAHLYQGILLYRRKDWPRAEDEFSSALNFDIPASMRADAAAWRHLAVVASGSCGASREQLERSLAAVSPDFPKDEARSALALCGTNAAK